MKDKKLSILYKNTMMLYILTFSSYFFGFISIPYQTRILGPDNFGRVGFALALMTYFRLIIDFGFLLSATEDVSKNRENKEIISQVVTSVTVIKLIFTLITFIIVSCLVLFIERLRVDTLLYIVTFLSVVTASFFPDYLYRGIEDMKTITIRTVIIRAFSVLMIFLLLQKREDYYLIPLVNLVGNIFANLFSYLHAFKVIGIRIIPVNKKHIINTLKKSSVFFYSRIASTVYTVTNTFLIGLIYPVGNNVLGWYTSADRLINTAKQGFAPIADSLYPYMINNKDFKLIKKILIIIMPVVILGAVIIGYYANDFVALLFGEEFRSAGKILRILMPIVIMTPPIYILGFPVLSPLGLSKHGNLSIIYSSIVHLTLLVLLFAFGKLNVFTLSYITVLSEFIILMYRIVVIWKKLNNKSIAV